MVLLDCSFPQHCNINPLFLFLILILNRKILLSTLKTISIAVAIVGRAIIILRAIKKRSHETMSIHAVLNQYKKKESKEIKRDNFCFCKLIEEQ